METTSDTERSNLDTLTERFPQPVTHGVGVSLHVPDVSLCERVGELARSEGATPEPGSGPVPVASYQPPFLKRSGNYALLLGASNWKAGKRTDAGYRPRSEYQLTLRERVRDGHRKEWRTPPVSLDIRFKPRSSGLVYRDGNPLALPFGEGTHLTIQTTYPEGPNDVVSRVASALSTAFGYDLSGYDPTSARITKLEAHHRIDNDVMNQLVECLENTKELICYGGDVALSFGQERTPEGWNKAHVKSDRWDLLGFDPAERTELLKLYHMEDRATRSRSDPLRRPKLEAAYRGGKPYPSLSEWNRVLTRLEHMVVEHLRWGGVGPSDLVADDYHDGPNAPARSYERIEGRREDLRARYERLEVPVIGEITKSNRTPLDVLTIMLESGGATYQILIEGTGLSYSGVRRQAKQLEDRGIVERVGNPTVVTFPAVYVERIVRETVNGYIPETVERRKEKRHRRAVRRRAKREGVLDAIEPAEGATRHTATIIDITPEVCQVSE